MPRIKCPKCESPRMHTKCVKTQYENFEEISYQCGAQVKLYPNERGKYSWQRECGFKIMNDYN